MLKYMTSPKKLPRAAGAAAALAALPFLIQLLSGTDYGVLIACIMLVYIISVSGLDILFGYSGQISLGHAAFFVIGAYTSGLLSSGLINAGGAPLHVPLYATIPLAAVVCALVGGLLAYPASKLKFHFLSLATIAFGEIVYNFLYVSPGGFTRDYLGINVMGIGFLKNYTAWYFFLLGLVLLALLIKYFLVNSGTGRAFMAIRENTYAADGMGVNVRKYKIIAFMVSAFYTGLAGALFVHLILYISPETGKQKQSVLFLTMLLFGGTGSMIGPIIGVVVLEILLELIRPLQEYQMLFYGILLLIVIVALPGGLYGGVKDALVSYRRRLLVKRNVGQVSRAGGGGDA
jgi:branched-chain amino acid transport system permease protein